MHQPLPSITPCWCLKWPASIHCFKVGGCLFRDAITADPGCRRLTYCFSSARWRQQLPLTECFLFLLPSPEMVHDSVKIPVDQPLVKHSDQPYWHQPSWLHHIFVLKWGADIVTVVSLADWLIALTKHVIIRINKASSKKLFFVVSSLSGDLLSIAKSTLKKRFRT